MIKCKIYYTYNILTTKPYIGQTISTLIERWKQHIKDAKKIKNQSIHFYRAILARGEKSFIPLELLEEKEFEEENINEAKIWMDIRESFYIEKFDSFNNGYNSTKGGGGILGLKHSEESKKKISLAGKGRIHTEDSKRKMSEAKMGNKCNLGKKRSQETKEKLSISNTGKKHSVEAKRKMSEAKMGNKNWLGKKHSEESKKKMSRASSGRIASDETKKKMSLAHKNNQTGFKKGHKNTENQKIKLLEAIGGEKNHNAKLTYEKVKEIRKDLINGKSPLFIAEKYGISRRNVYEIKNNRIWKEK